MTGIAIVSAGLLGLGIHFAAASETGSTGTAAPTVTCPSVADRLTGVPAGAQAGVGQELANLDRQIAEANRRLVTSQGQGGPNFVQNAILGPLADKRKAALDRIAIDIRRVGGQPPAGLDALATCGLSR
ncbi:hypothetical protein ACNTMW_17670 [Planosporangium sp. 12N6]|uniref:hypothetical protein n=1 Tax=Planosporangium spinosum TaxID=3402278 RepID=UPI003CE7A3EB